MKTVRMGVIGLGVMGSAHAFHIYKGLVEGMKLTAVCDTDKERRRWGEEKLGKVHVFDDPSLLLSSGKVDAVLIATPHPSHPEIAMEAFRKGIHVLSEKPAGIDVYTVEKENEEAKKSGVVFGIMYNQRTDPLFQSLRDYYRSGMLGELIRFDWVITNWFRTQAYYDSGSWRATWQGEGGGILMNQCPHNLDIWQWITGMPARIWASCKTSGYHDIQVEDTAYILAEYENGATASFTASTAEYPGTNRIEFAGTKGKAVIEDAKLTVTLINDSTESISKNSAESMPVIPVGTMEQYQSEKESGHIGILNDFCKAVRTGSPLLAPGTEGIKGLSIANAAYLSNWTGKWVELPLDGKKYLKKLQDIQKEYSFIKPDKQPEKQMISGEYMDRWNIRW
ncbi:MAG: Gfo/Idh/MocA family oxidoreductase [Butyrivibrio sp.]|nr:Gfo/Idh/MocA family oxidoreductase [Butyrivibrio sp.]